MERIEREEQTSARELLSVEQLKKACSQSQPVKFGDPILAHTRLNRRATFYPLGFPVSIATNSGSVLQAAKESWGCFSPLFETAPIRLQVTVVDDGSLVCPPTPACRMRNHIVTNIADADNYAVTDLSSLTSTIWVTRATIRHRDYFRYFFLESAAMGCVSSAYSTGIHAACVALNEEAVLLCGDSGAGKTTLSYACARAGWTYVTDDGSYLVHGKANNLVAGNCHQVRFRPSAEALFPQLHGREVMRRAGVGKPSIEVPIVPGDAIRTSSTGHVGYMVFLERNVSKQELCPFPRAVARMYLWQTAQCMPYQMNRHLETIENLLDLKIVELRYNSLEWAIERLEHLVREGQ